MPGGAGKGCISLFPALNGAFATSCRGAGVEHLCARHPVVPQDFIHDAEFKEFFDADFQVGPRAGVAVST